MMDNLTAHKHPMVLQLITAHGHRYLFRAPYYPVDGPVEYVFDYIENSLRIEMHNIYTIQDVRDKIIDIFNGIDSFAPYFHHVGFR